MTPKNSIDAETRHKLADDSAEPRVQPIDLPWREVKEWIGKTPDTKPPTAVRMRVLLRYQGRCYLSGQKIKTGDPWDIEHVKPLRSALPGEPHLNRESNMAPALKAPHREKTGSENSDGAKADRIHANHFGYAEKPRSRLTHPTLKRRFDGSVVPR